MAVFAYYNISQMKFEFVRRGMRQFEMICVIRNVRIGTLMKEVKIFRNMHEFCVKMTGPLLMMFVSMYFFFYCFAVIGNTLLGGLVTNQSA